MNIRDLKRGNELIEIAKKCDDLLSCFDWPEEMGVECEWPTLLVSFDSVKGKKLLPLPVSVSNRFLNEIRSMIAIERDSCLEEFKEL